MDNNIYQNSLSAIREFLKVSYIICGLLAAWLGFLGIRDHGREGRLRNWLGNRWEDIETGKGLKLPELVIRLLIEAIESLIKWQINIPYDDLIFRWSASVLPILAIIVSWAVWGAWAAAIVVFLSLPVLFLSVRPIIAVKAFLSGRKTAQNTDEFLTNLMPWFVTTVFCLIYYTVFLCVLLVAFWIFIFKEDVFAAAITSIVMFPFGYMLYSLPLFTCLALIELAGVKVGTKRKRKELSAKISMSISLSLSLSLCALSIGHYIDPTGYVPRTLQMLIANFIFDLISVWLTYKVLSWISRGTNTTDCISGILGVGVATLLFAGCSLYGGLAFSGHALTVHEIMYILVGLSNDGQVIHMGPYFWIMHTTSIPILICILLIICGYIAKLMTYGLRLILGKKREDTDPVKLTGMFLGLIAAILAAFDLLLSWVVGNSGI